MAAAESERSLRSDATATVRGYKMTLLVTFFLICTSSQFQKRWHWFHVCSASDTEDSSGCQTYAGAFSRQHLVSFRHGGNKQRCILSFTFGQLHKQNIALVVRQVRGVVSHLHVKSASDMTTLIMKNKA